MGKLYEQLKEYFETTPKEQLDKDWEELKHWNEIGPDVTEFVDTAMKCYNQRHFDYKLIDLGLPSGTLWMDKNIGARTPYEYGLYFPWAKANNVMIDYTNGECNVPTKEQLLELIDNTTSEWITLNGANGRLFTSKTNHNSIFVPAAGYFSENTSKGFDSIGYLHSNSLSDDYTDSAWYLGFNCVGVDVYYGNRYYGRTLRGIKTK